MCLSSSIWSLQDISNISTISSPILGLIAAFIAWKTYRDNIFEMRKSKMHDVLRELLALEVQGSECLEKLISFKFYAVEEIFIWNINNKSRALNSHSEEDYNAWNETIKSHLDNDLEESKKYFQAKKKIFDLRFQRYVDNYYNIDCK